jgi:hypothetical protein
MKLSLLIVLVIALSACTKKTQGEKPMQEKNDATAVSYASSRMTLVGEAQQAALAWEDYQKFMTELENYDHSKPATNRLVELADAMSNTIPSTLAEQPVLSRLVVLRSRIGVYGSAIRNNNLSKNERIIKYNEFVLALDQLHIQLNEKPNYDNKIDDLMNILEGEFEVPADSLTPVN